MVDQQALQDVEKRFRAAGYSLRGFCSYAEIAPSTWTRWKAAETAPNMATWAKIKEAVARLEVSQ